MCMKIGAALVIISAGFPLFAFAVDSRYDSSRAPQPSSFPAEPMRAHAAPDVRFRLVPAARHHRTIIGEAYAKGANFSGSYTIAEFGCGTSCVGLAIVRRRDGEVVFYKPILSASVIDISYQKESSLLVLNRLPDGSGPEALCDAAAECPL